MRPERRPGRGPSRRTRSGGNQRDTRGRRKGNRPSPLRRGAGRWRDLVVGGLRRGVAAVFGMARRLAPIVAAGAVLAGAVGLGRLVERHLRSSPYFALRHVVVHGAERLGEAEVRALAGLQDGRNVFELSPRRVVRALRSHPWIASAEARRRLPDGYEVTITERHPVAVALREGEPWWVDETGEVFAPTGPEGPADLPVISGLRWSHPRRLRRQLEIAVSLVHDWRALRLEDRARLEEVHFEPGDDVTLWLARPRLQVRLGADGHRRRLRLLRRTLDRVARRRWRVRRIALDGERRRRRVVLQLDEAGG